jgi:HAD superfamily hydrolase (TIGR01509 family)
MTIAAVILDVDGTLVDSNDAHTRAWVDAFAAEGITVARDAVRRAIGMGSDKLLPAVAGIEASSRIGTTVSARRAELFKQRELPRIRAFDGTEALARRFTADGFVLAVASSAKEDELAPLLERAGVAKLVAKRTSSDDADRSKPDPDIVTAAVKGAHADPSQSIMLGDTPYDVEAAARAGIRIVGLECGGWSRNDLSGALAVYVDPADLLAHYDTSPFARLATARTS